MARLKNTVSIKDPRNAIPLNKTTSLTTSSNKYDRKKTIPNSTILFGILNFPIVIKNANASAIAPPMHNLTVLLGVDVYLFQLTPNATTIGAIDTRKLAI